MTWSWWALPGLIGVVFATTVAAFVYFSRPDRAQNRWLGLFIFLEAVYIGTTVPARALLDEAAFRGTLPLSAMLSGAAIGPYLFFLATLDTPIVRPLRHRLGVAAIALFTASATAAWWFWPKAYFRGVEHRDGLWYVDSGPLDYILGGAIPMAAFLFGLAVAISAWRRAALGTAARLRARAYAFAFGFRDASYALVIAASIWAAATSGETTERRWMIIGPVVQVVYLGTLVYGIAKNQLFDIDLKIKWTLRRGTVAGLLLAVFFIAVAITEQFLEQYGVIAGGISVGLLLFFIRPIQSAADRLADRAMPGVESTPQYVAFRKLEVYKATVEELVAGGLTAKERRALGALRDKLEIPAADAARVEQDVRALSARHPNP